MFVWSPGFAFWGSMIKCPGLRGSSYSCAAWKGMKESKKRRFQKWADSRDNESIMKLFLMQRKERGCRLRWQRDEVSGRVSISFEQNTQEDPCRVEITSLWLRKWTNLLAITFFHLFALSSPSLPFQSLCVWRDEGDLHLYFQACILLYSIFHPFLSSSSLSVTCCLPLFFLSGKDQETQEREGLREYERILRIPSSLLCFLVDSFDRMFYLVVSLVYKEEDKEEDEGSSWLVMFMLIHLPLDALSLPASRVLFLIIFIICIMFLPKESLIWSSWFTLFVSLI